VSVTTTSEWIVERNQRSGSEIQLQEKAGRRRRRPGRRHQSLPEHGKQCRGRRLLLAGVRVCRLSSAALCRSGDQSRPGERCPCACAGPSTSTSRERWARPVTTLVTAPGARPLRVERERRPGWMSGSSGGGDVVRTRPPPRRAWAMLLNAVQRAAETIFWDGAPNVGERGPEFVIARRPIRRPRQHGLSSVRSHSPLCWPSSPVIWSSG